MNELIDETADYVLDLASSQRLSILFKLLEKKNQRQLNLPRIWIPQNKKFIEILPG